MSWVDWAKILGGAAGAPFTGGATLGLAAAGIGGLLANKGKQTSSSSTTPTLDPAYGPLQQSLISSIMGRLQQGGTLPPGYQTQGIANINKTYDLVGQNLDNSLTGRGLGRSPIAGAASEQLQQGRAGNIADFNTQLPLVQRELQNQDLGMAQSILGMGRGGATGTSTQETSLGGGAAGAFTNIAQLLGYLYGKQGQQGGLNGWPGQQGMING